MLSFHVLSLEGRKRRERRVINISSGSGTGDFEGMLRIEVGQEDSPLCRWIRGTCDTPHVYPDPDHPLADTFYRGNAPALILSLMTDLV